MEWMEATAPWRVPSLNPNHREGVCAALSLRRRSAVREEGCLISIFLFHFLVTESPIASQTHSDAPGGR